MSETQEDMTWEANEIDRALDYVNVASGALFSAYIGVQLASRVASVGEIIKVIGLVYMVALMAFAIRNIARAVVQSLETPGFLTLAIVTVISGGIGVYAIARDSIFQFEVIVSIVAAWMGVMIIACIGLVLRRWIKLYD